MDPKRWTITLQVFRQKVGQAPHFEAFTLDVDPDEYVLDAVERIWAFHDRTLAFRHACHHSACGACGMRVDGVEKLTCITPIRAVTHNGGTFRIEPLRNFPVVSDLVVDMGGLYRWMEAVGYPQVTPVARAPLGPGISPSGETEQPETLRLNDCIECGLCISACPIATTAPDYLGPAPLAGAQFRGVDAGPGLRSLVDTQDGVWRCHSIYECTQVCPSYVEPGWRIMDLRRQVLAQRLHGMFFPNKEARR